jgi:leucyl aminopeptidase (aminopeptidase T)
MVTAARNALVHVLGLQPKDTVLVVTDEETQRIGQVFQEAAVSLGCSVQMYFLPERERPLAEVPDAMSRLLAGTTVVVNLFQARAKETPFRIKWIFEIHATKRIRLGHAPGITESMMTEGPMNVDYAAMHRAAEDLVGAFENAETVQITAPAGTDVVLGIAGRSFLSDVLATVERGSNLPCGEVYCAPEETKADGILVVDGSIGDIGRLAKPLWITLEKGRIKDLRSETPDLVNRIMELTNLDSEARVIGELGIGLNPGAKLTGNMLEDEKSFRTAHIAFGNNLDFPGGKNRSQTHRDFLFFAPTLTVTYQNGSQRVLIQDGNICL